MLAGHFSRCCYLGTLAVGQLSPATVIASPAPQQTPARLVRRHGRPLWALISWTSSDALVGR